MNKTTIAIALLSSIFSVSAMADGHHGHEGHDGYSWGSWIRVASAAPELNEAAEAPEAPEPAHAPISAVPAGTANYSGSTLAVVSDSSSGSMVRSVSTGAVNLAVTFNGSPNTTETGTITGLTGTAGAAIGDLAFTGTGVNKHFAGTVTSATIPAVAATATSAATGTGVIRGELSNAVVLTPAIAATTTAAAVPAVVAAPLSASGGWNFVATPTLKVNGGFVAIKQ
ncbi:MAG TPA: hypothetical protein VMV33_07555 [Rhodocyclaceae bacterium]|nr:hypothetical protein [Rhodocyclaceae bacterium]